MKPHQLLLGAAAGGALVLLTAGKRALGVRWTKPLDRSIVSSGWGDLREYRNGIHAGIDLHAPTGTSIRSVVAGTVVRVDNVDDSYAGRHVVVATGAGVWVRYLHCNSVFVHLGERVARSAPIATVGSTGTSSGSPHLHLEVEVDVRLAAAFAGVRPAVHRGVGGYGIVIPAESVVPVDGYEPDVVASAAARAVALRSA